MFKGLVLVCGASLQPIWVGHRRSNEAEVLEVWKDANLPLVNGLVKPFLRLTVIVSLPFPLWHSFPFRLRGLYQTTPYTFWEFQCVYAFQLCVIFSV